MELKDQQFYIISIDRLAYWKPGRQGYTFDRNEAGIYSYAQALEIVLEANYFSIQIKEVMMPVDHGVDAYGWRQCPRREVVFKENEE